MRIKSIDGYAATCEAKGIEREVSLFMLQGEPLAVGDHVLIHVGYAIQKISEEEARITWDLFDEILEHA
jgi:hydrogenase expression/formation protein HypC